MSKKQFRSVVDLAPHMLFGSSNEIQSKQLTSKNQHELKAWHLVVLLIVLQQG